MKLIGKAALCNVKACHQAKYNVVLSKSKEIALAIFMATLATSLFYLPTRCSLNKLKAGVIDRMPL